MIACDYYLMTFAINTLTRQLIGLAIFLGSFLLFQVQPLVVKLVLPTYGGSAPVWTTSFIFFTTWLVLGYFIAYRVSTVPKRQIWYRAIILFSVLLGLLFLFGDPLIWGRSFVLAVSESGLPTALSVLATLLVLIGPFYLILATISTTLQSWHHTLFPNKNPYVLYGLSNAGSLLGLLSYPLLVEPMLSLSQQIYFWIFLLLVVLALLLVAQLQVAKKVVAKKTDPKNIALLKKVNLNTRVMWIILGAIPVLILITGTLQLTQAVASIPLIWVGPLAAYLLSFIVSFSERPLLFGLTSVLAIASSLLAFVSFFYWIALPLWWHIVIIHALVFLVGCHFHRQLYESRPNPISLPGFYVATALGGALASVLANLVFPSIYDNYWDLPVAIIITLFVLAMYQGLTSVSGLAFRKVGRIALLLVVIIGLISLQTYIANRLPRFVAIERNFYSSQAIIDELDTEGFLVRKLRHGSITHGAQVLDQASPRYKIPGTYYKEQSGVGLVLAEYYKGQEAGKAANVHIIGLGAGALSAYCHLYPMNITYYEINPLVAEWAEDYFTYLDDCPTEQAVEVVDGRIGVDQATEPIDVLILDAFSDDAIPSHLLTTEAFQIYQGKVKEGGLIIVHISNRHLDLYPVLHSVAANFDLQAEKVSYFPDVSDADNLGSIWVSIHDGRYNLLEKEIGQAELTVRPAKAVKPWTDGYINIFSAL